MPVYKLKYFNVMGLGEPIRFLLSYGGAEFDDIRFTRESKEWEELKPKTPFGQVPILEFDGKVYAQTLPICRYLAKQYNLLGKSDLDALHIDVAANGLHDLRKYAAEIFREEDAAAKKKKMDDIVPRVISPLLATFEELVKNNGGYIHGGELSYADLFFVAISDGVSYVCEFDVTENHPNLKKLKEKVLALPRIKEWVAKRPKTNF